MRWQEIAVVLYLTLGGALTIIGVRIVASHLGGGGGMTRRNRAPTPLRNGIIMLTIGGAMLLVARRVLDLLVATR
jgi:hypothetical protein